MDLACDECGASLRVEPQLRTARCPYCAAPAVVERPPGPGLPEPRFTLGFALGQQGAREVVQGWQKSRGFFRDPRVRSAPIEEMKGLYVPAYLYAAVARSSYRADIGENYTETETYTTTENGRTVTRTRTVIRTEWRSLAGQRVALIPDVIVTASRGVDNAELGQIEPYDLRSLHRYSPHVLSGWIAENPTMPLDECLGLARREAIEQVGRDLARFMPGDSHRGLTHQTGLEQETIDLVHVPLWVLAVRHDPQKPAVRLLVNGQTGKVWGKAPLSGLRVAIGIVALLLVIGAVVAAIVLLGDA